MVIDSGSGLSTIRGYLENCAEFVDYVKLGWGTALVSATLEEKIRLYRQYDVPVCLGGTFFELAHLHAAGLSAIVLNSQQSARAREAALLASCEPDAFVFVSPEPR